MATTGSRLKHIRELKQISQGDLAGKTGVSKGTISMAERNVTAITIDNLGKLCKALQVSADYIIFGEVSERDDEWRRLSATEDGLSVRQVVLNLHKDKKLVRFLETIVKLPAHQLDIVLQLAKSLQESGKD